LNSTLAHALRSLQRNILAGILAIAPLFVTYLIFSFVLGILANAGRPLLWLLSVFFPGSKPAQPWVQFVVAILLTLVVLYVVGRITSEFAGRRALGLFEGALERLPIVHKIYGSVRQLVDNMTAKKESTQRVVLVDFPIEGHKSIGFLSRTLTDSTTGELLAAVLLPNAINPTSAFLQLLPMRNVVETDMSMEQAMSMLLTGGAVGPETLRYSNAECPQPSAELPTGTIARANSSVETVDVAVLVPAGFAPRSGADGADRSGDENRPSEFPPADRPPF
jgi:uncharacterized membrane protein